MGSIAKMEKRMALGALDDSWYMPGGSFYGGVGPQTKAGAQVSEFNAMQLSVVWACIKMLSEDSASLPLHLYRRRKGGGKDRAWADDRYFLLHDQPNPEMTAMSFRESYASHLLSWGNGYAEQERTGGRINKLVALWPVTPNRVTVRRNAKRKIEYQVNCFNTGEWAINGTSNAGGSGNVVLPKENMLHTPGLSFNGLYGYSPIAAAREAIGLGKALEEFGGLYFGNGMHPGAVITHENPIKDISATRQAFNEVYGGLGKAHRLMLLEAGMKFEKVGIPPEDSQFLESRKFQNIDIGTRIYRFPPQMYGEFDKASTYASAEQFTIDYVTKTLRAWLVRLEQSYNMALLDRSEYGVYFFEHNVEGLLRGDILTRYQAHVLGKRNGFLNADEIRDTENYNPIPDGLGQEYIVEKNMIGLDDLGKDVQPVIVQKKSAKVFDFRKVDKIDWEAIYAEGGAHWADDLQPSKFAQDFAQKLIDEGKKSVLEIGCGNGRDSILFALAGLKVTSIDMVQDAVDMAIKNAKNADVAVDFQAGNAEKLTFPDKSFDAVFTLSVLHSTNMKKSIPEVYRVLKSKGIAFVYIYSNVEKIDGTKTEFISVDEYVDLVKAEGFTIGDIYTTPEDEYDGAGEKHLLIVSELRK